MRLFESVSRMTREVFSRAHVQQHRAPERRAAIGQHHAGHEGQFGVQLHPVEVQQAGVLLFQLQCRLAPGAHLLKLAPKLGVLFVEP